jgi:DNA recombination protein RmuC
MAEIMLMMNIVLLVAVLVLLVLLLRKSSHDSSSVLGARLDVFEKAQERTERVIREEVAQSREELGKATREQRQELAVAFQGFGDSVAQRIIELASMQKGQLDTFSGQLASFAQASGEKLDAVRTESATAAKQLREEVVTTLTSLSASNEKKLEAIKVTVEGELQSMKADNAKQLEQMRQTVDEKLQGTLERRLGESFKLVSERLEQVHKGLGEMQALATGVGDLKKVLTNVKARGTWGEVQLGALLEQVLNPDQFGTNVATKNTNERVEFAIKLPGQSANKDEVVWLPIDAKFPLEDYQRLLEAQERADVEAMEIAGKQLENRIKSCARDICEKYLNPPQTTDFGILFLPVEGLFAEAIRRLGLTEVIQRDYRVVIAGPTTLWSILSSLQMGFRTLAIQQRTSEVWNLLGAVKTEWMKYGEVLDAVQKKLNQASDTIERAKVRSRAIGRKLKDVQELPVDQANALLPDSLREDDAESIASESEGITQLEPVDS